MSTSEPGAARPSIAQVMPDGQVVLSARVPTPATVVADGHGATAAPRLHLPAQPVRLRAREYLMAHRVIAPPPGASTEHTVAPETVGGSPATLAADGQVVVPAHRAQGQGPARTTQHLVSPPPDGTRTFDLGGGQTLTFAPGATQATADGVHYHLSPDGNRAIPENPPVTFDLGGGRSATFGPDQTQVTVDGVRWDLSPDRTSVTAENPPVTFTLNDGPNAGQTVTFGPDQTMQTVNGYTYQLVDDRQGMRALTVEIDGQLVTFDPNQPTTVYDGLTWTMTDDGPQPPPEGTYLTIDDPDTGAESNYNLRPGQTSVTVPGSQGPTTFVQGAGGTWTPLPANLNATDFEVELDALATATQKMTGYAASIEDGMRLIRKTFADVQHGWLSPSAGPFGENVMWFDQVQTDLAAILQEIIRRLGKTHQNYLDAEQTVYQGLDGPGGGPAPTPTGPGPSSVVPAPPGQGGS